MRGAASICTQKGVIAYPRSLAFISVYLRECSLGKLTADERGYTRMAYIGQILVRASMVSVVTKSLNIMK